jgi:serine/threonine protein kinase
MSERTIFLTALDKGDPTERAAYLDEACAGDAPLRERVEALLWSHEQAGSFLDQPPGEAGATGDQARATETETPSGGPPDGPGSHVGRYRLLEEIGEGGMGSVWMAQQTEPVRRLVAVKLIKPGMDSRAVLARFEAERQALALMDHPNIAKVHDAGTADGRRPYFVMELVKGVPITKYCDDNRLTVRQRLDLFVPVCQAVQHAHQKGIIHRDLKPRNVLVARYDGRPVPKVIDFGVAKAAGQPLTEQTLTTGFGALVGTPEYMSPEQAGLNQLDVDTRSDIYSLGVLLYELLAGSPPFSRQGSESASVLEVLRMIREREPAKPSSRLSTDSGRPALAANRGTEPRRLTALVRGELDWVVMKALEKDRNRRYESASAFAADVQRYLGDEPVQAGPPTTWYRLRKFMRRHRGPVLAAAAVVVALVGGMVGTTLGLVRAEQALAAEAKQRGIAEASELEAQAQKTEAQAQKQRAVEFRDKALGALRAATGEDVEKLIGSKKQLGPPERAYLEAIAGRWQAFAAQEGDDEQAQRLRGEGHFQVARLWDKLGRPQEALAEYEKAEEVMTKLADRFPDSVDYQRNLAATLVDFANELTGFGGLESAAAKYRAARDIHEALAGRYPAVTRYQQELAGTYDNLGSLYTRWHNYREARTAYEHALTVRTSLADRFPADPVAQRDLADSHCHLAFLLEKAGKRDEAKTELESALRTRVKLAEEFRAIPSYRFFAAVMHGELGRLFADFGGRATAADRERARAELLRAIDLEEGLAREFPAVSYYQDALADSHHNLGLLFSDLGKWDEARKQYEQARHLYERLAEQFPDSRAYQRDLAISHADFGMLLAKLRRLGEARDELGRAVDMMTSLVERYPDVPGYQLKLGGDICNLGVLFLREDKYADAVERFGSAIKTLAPLHEGRSQDPTATVWLRNSHANRALALVRMGKYAAAVKDCDRAIELSAPPEQAKYRALRATARLRAGQVAEAVTEVAELTSSGAGRPGAAGWSAGHWYEFACVYAAASGKVADRSREYADRAMELLRQAVRAGFKDLARMAKDADLDPIRDRDDFKKLLAELQAGKEKPKD